MKGSSVVIDVNVWISYFIMARLPQLVTFIVDNELTVFSCNELIDELTNVLNREKFDKYLKQPVEDYIDFHSDLTQFVDIELIFKDSPDIKDNYLFDLALQYDAAYLITGDKKLLAMETVESVQVISLADFKEQLANAD